MANLVETASYDAGVYQIETVDPVVGGPGGIANLQAQALADRTAYLYLHVSNLENGITIPGTIAPINSPALTGTPTGPTAAAGSNNTQLANTAFVQQALSGVLTLSVAGSANVTLTSTQAGNGILIFTGALTGNINVIVPATPTRSWVVVNGTTGAYTLTLKTAAGTGVAVTQGLTSQTFTDGVNVYSARTDFQSVALTGAPTAPTAGAGSSSTQIASTAFVGAAITALGPLQAALGYTPVRQGDGATLLSNPVSIGWTAGSQLGVRVDATVYGSTWPISISGNAATATSAVSATNAAQLGGVAAASYATQSWVTSQGYITALAVGTTYAPLASPNFTGTPALGGAALATQAWVTAYGYLPAATATATYAPKGGAGTSGTWPISITGNCGGSSTSCTGNAATATSATTATNAANATNASYASSAGSAVTVTTGLGINQTWQTVTTSRASGVTYYNTTGRPIMVSLLLYGDSVANFYVNGLLVGNARSSGSYLNGNGNTFIVPVGASYMATMAAFAWTELR